ncbi:MAG: DUF4738 domain-containing protein [Prevotella sp.]|nr:DUF4738 domain-containing protein [Prevotella sp.]
MWRALAYMLMILAVFSSCRNKGTDYKVSHEDKKAKEMLQGLWTDEEGSDPAMLVRGDSIFYPDSASMPVRFWVYQDTLYIQGQHVNGYKIEKQAPHLLKFSNQNGDEVKLVKSGDKALRSSFDYHVYAMNTFDEQAQDTVVRTDLGYFESKIRVETTPDRVVKSTYNDDGIEVDNMYLDNVASLTILNHGNPVFAHDFRKQEFQSLIPKNFLSQCILRRMSFTHVDTKALYFDVVIGIPDASTTYVIEVRVTPTGRMSKRLH